jgi:hypothetical protein
MNMIMIDGGWECRKCAAFDADNCPECPPFTGIPGKDALCDKHWKEYLGTHCGGRGDE